jgi:hypothetical protein
MYLLMYVIGFILVIGGIWLLWRGETVEGMADTSTVVMTALGGNNTYFADVGLTNQPNWSMTGGTYKQISGSMGRLIGVNSQDRAYYGTKFDIAGSAFNWLAIPGNVMQVSFDYPMVVGLNLSKTVVYIDNVPSNPQTAVWLGVGGTQASKTFNYIAMNNGMAVGAGVDNKVWYCSDIRLPVWVDISTGLLSGIVVKNIAFDGNDLAVVDTNNNVYVANNMDKLNVAGVMPNWKTLTQKMKQVSIRNHMGAGLGEDNRIYFAARVNDGNWAAITGPSGGAIWAELYYPVGANVITFHRPNMSIKGGTSPCPSGYTLYGGACYSNCTAGYMDNGENCSYIATIAGAQVAVNTGSAAAPATNCISGYTPVPTGTSSCIRQTDGSIGTMNNGICPNSYSKVDSTVCLSPCPPGNTVTITECIPPSIPKLSTPAVTDNYSCSTGFLNTNNRCSDPCPFGYKLQERGNVGGKVLYGTKCIDETLVPDPPYTPIMLPYNSRLPDAAYTKLVTKGDDQTITRGAKVRYVRIRPPTTGGDGIINLSQIIVLDMNGSNIARNKIVTASSTNSAYDPPAVLVDGSTVIRKPTSARFSQYGTAILAPLTWKNIGVNRNYPTANNIGSPVPVTGLADAQAKCLAASGCNGFSITSDPSPTAQLMDITESTEFTSVTSLYNYSNARLDPNDPTWVVRNNAHYSMGTISVNPSLTVEEAKIECRNIVGCIGFTFWGESHTKGYIEFKNVAVTQEMTGYWWAPVSTYRLSDAILAQGTPVVTNTIYITSDPNWDITYNSQHYGQGDIGRYVGNLKDAKTRCVNTPGCTEFVYTDGTAYLKNMILTDGVWDETSLPRSLGVTTYALTNSIKQGIVSRSVVSGENGVNGVWAPATNDRSKEFVEVDLGSEHEISGVRLIGRRDYNYTTNMVDRMTGVRIELYMSTTVVVPTIDNNASNSTCKEVRVPTNITPRYIRFRAPSSQGDIPAWMTRGDGYLSIAQVGIISAWTGGGPMTWGGGMPNIIYMENLPVFVTSTQPNSPPGSSITSSSWRPSSSTSQFCNLAINDGWTSGTPKINTEFAEVDTGVVGQRTSNVIAVLIKGLINYTGLNGNPDRTSGMRVEFISEAVSTNIVNGCPVGYTSRANNTVCVENCPTGYNYSFNEGTSSHSCLFELPGIQTTTTSATYIPPCPSGTTRVGNLCYSPCAAGTTDVGSNTCQPAISKRTQGPKPTVTLSNLCTPPLVYVESINACSPVCPTGSNPLYSGGETKCTKPDVPRTTVPAVLSYSCNANEILQNGVCVSKCPDGTAPDGDICVPQMKVIEKDVTIKCTGSPYNNSKKWMCESSDDFDALITNPSKTTSYITATDQVCVTENLTTKMYFCITGAEAMAGINPLSTLKEDFSKTCQVIRKSYTDLSNNLTNLVKIQSGMQGGSTQLGAAKNSLNSIYSQMNCLTATDKKLQLCNQIKAAATTLGTNSSEVSTRLDTVIPMLTKALGTRDEIIGYRSKFQCPGG